MLGTSSLLLLVAAPAKAGGSHQNIMLIMWEPLIMQELLISIMQEPKSGHSWTSKVFNTVITLDTYQFLIKNSPLFNFLPNKWWSCDYFFFPASEAPKNF